jgi:hypothetical protein
VPQRRWIWEGPSDIHREVDNRRPVVLLDYHVLVGRDVINTIVTAEELIAR